MKNNNKKIDGRTEEMIALEPALKELLKERIKNGEKVKTMKDILRKL